jgi:hypothetical protein
MMMRTATFLIVVAYSLWIFAAGALFVSLVGFGLGWIARILLFAFGCFVAYQAGGVAGRAKK